MRTASIILALALSAPVQAALPATRPSPDELHAAAVAMMRAKQYQKATAPLDQAYRSRPLAQQPRALVLNHAMLDIIQRVNVMRAIKDLQGYLDSTSATDEAAVNLLGAALQQAGKNPRTAELEIYQKARRKLDNCVEALQGVRPGEHKWGPKWISESDYEPIKQQIDRATERYQVEQDRADRLRGALEAAQAEVQRYNSLNTNIGHRHARASDAQYCPECQAARQRSIDAENARNTATRLEGDHRAQKQIAERARSAIPQPDWMTEFKPIDPGEITPPANPAAATAPSPTLP